jgi:hypothetical protein
MTGGPLSGQGGHTFTGENGRGEIGVAGSGQQRDVYSSNLTHAERACDGSSSP